LANESLQRLLVAAPNSRLQLERWQNPGSHPAVSCAAVNVEKLPDSLWRTQFHGRQLALIAFLAFLAFPSFLCAEKRRRRKLVMLRKLVLLVMIDTLEKACSFSLLQGMLGMQFSLGFIAVPTQSMLGVLSPVC